MEKGRRLALCVQNRQFFYGRGPWEWLNICQGVYVLFSRNSQFLVEMCLDDTNRAHTVGKGHRGDRGRCLKALVLASSSFDWP